MRKTAIIFTVILSGIILSLPACKKTESTDETPSIQGLSITEAVPYVAVGDELVFNASTSALSVSKGTKPSVIGLYWQVNSAKKDTLSRDVRTEKGTFRELLNRAGSDDYIEAQLEDEKAQIDAMGTLRIRFPNLLHLRYLNIQGRDEAFVPEGTDIEDKSDLELFTEFFRMQNGDVPMNDRERGYFLQILQEMEDRG